MQHEHPNKEEKMINAIEFKDLDRFVLSPGAKFYKTMYENRDCTSPDDLADLMSLRFGVENGVVLDFLYDRIPVDDRLARMVLEATGLCSSNLADHYYNSRVVEYMERCAEYVRLKEDENYTVIGIDELVNGNLNIIAEDIENIGLEIDRFVAENYLEKEKLVKVKALLLQAWSILQTVKSRDEVWLAATIKRERDLGNRISLADAVLTQRRSLLGEQEYHRMIRPLKEWTACTEITCCHVSGLLRLEKDLEDSVLRKLTDEIVQHAPYRCFSGQKAKHGILPWFLC